MARYAMRRELDVGYDEARKKVTEALQAEGFGILSEIDVQDTLKKKLGVDMPRYEILGACHPASAHRALQAEKSVGLLLPCNVVVYEGEGQTVIEAIDPRQAMTLDANATVKDVAEEVRGRLQHVLERL